MSRIIFSTIHGSHLYGFAHEGSDFDYFIVTDGNERARQRVIGDNDTTIMGLSTFLNLANSGSHQSVEALFSRKKTWGPAADAYAPMLSMMRIGGSDVYAKYFRTIKSFCFGDSKKRRHAARLRINLAELMMDNRIDSVTLRPPQIRTATTLAATFEGQDLYDMLAIPGPMEERWRSSTQ